jgi:dihydropteroate synthase
MKAKPSSLFLFVFSPVRFDWRTGLNSNTNVIWKTARREIQLDITRVIGVLNVTPDSFSDGGQFDDIDAAVSRAEQMISEGVDIIDIGGESTRPGSARVSADAEMDRVIPIVAAVAKRFDVPLSVDTSRVVVAEAAIRVGAEIINDISGLRWEPQFVEVAANSNAGLILMHSRGEFETMHSLEPVADIFQEVSADFRRSIAAAVSSGVRREAIALDIGIGFGKTFEQNLELIAKLDKLLSEFPDFPILVGASRKSFIGRLLGGVPADQRSAGSLASVAIAVWNGAKLVRVHDVKATVDVVRTVEAIKRQEETRR